jgi:uncharacterized protein (TIGR02145 family)
MTILKPLICKPLISLTFVFLMFGVGCDKSDDEIIEKPVISYGTFTDNRDNKTYKWVKVDSTTWMAENLAYLQRLDSTVYVYGYEGYDVDEAKNLNNYKTYGCLYNWESANKNCPVGWRLPTKDEWMNLFDAVGGEDDAGIMLREKGFLHWKSTFKFYYNGVASGEYDVFHSVSGLDSIGFSALPGGWAQFGYSNPPYTYYFGGLGESCAFWGTPLYDNKSAVYVHIWGHSEGASISREGYIYGNSVRCVKIEN